MSEFTFKEIDQEGLETLKSISEANRFNAWMHNRIQPYCSGNILEIGSGIGNISEYFIQNGESISLTDIRDNYLDFLKDKYGPKAKNICKLDIALADFEDKHPEHIEAYDTVFALNVIEHIFDDTLAIKNIYNMLKPGGHIIILVPAYQALFNSFDEALEHYRRYTSSSLSSLISTSEFDIISADYFNAAGIAGWWFTGSILKKKTIPGGQMKLYNSLVPIFKIVDKVLFNKIGLSTICVAKKK